MGKFWVEDGSLAKASTADGLRRESERTQRWPRAFGMRVRVEKQDGEVQPHVSKTGTFVQFLLQNYFIFP